MARWRRWNYSRHSVRTRVCAVVVGVAFVAVAVAVVVVIIIAAPHESAGWLATTTTQLVMRRATRAVDKCSRRQNIK